MKRKLFFLLLLSFSIIAGYAQSTVTKVTIKDEVYYLAKNIGYPITGLYKYEGRGEPIVQLNEDGTGLLQLHGMSQTKMVWGIECDAKGVPKKMEGPNGSIYGLWYQIKEKHKGKTWESGVVDDWDVVQFSVHTHDKMMYILGERIKGY